jgi:iron complex transport system permease protein
MVSFALLLYRFIFQKVAQQNIYFLLLVGLICSTLFDNMITFFQVLLDPDEFQIAAYAGFASFNIVKMETVGLAVLTILPILLYSFKHHHRLNVMALGRDPCS